MRVSRRVKWVLIGVAIAALAAAGIVYLEWDLPRRKVQNALASRLGAKVRLGGLQILGTRSFVLRNLRVTEIPWQPRIEQVRIGSLEVSGSLGEINSGRFESMHGSDVEVRVLATPAAFPPSGTQSAMGQVVIGRLDIERGTIVLVPPAGTPQSAPLVLDAKGTLVHIGEGLEGDLALAAKRLEVAPLARFVTAFAGVGASAALTSETAGAGPAPAGSIEQGIPRSASESESSARVRPTQTPSGPTTHGVQRVLYVSRPNQAIGPAGGNSSLSRQRFIHPIVFGGLSSIALASSTGTGKMTGGQDLARPLPLGGVVRDVEGAVHIAEKGNAFKITLGASEAVLTRGDRSIALPSPAIAIDARRDSPPNGPLLIEIAPKFALFESASVSARLDPATSSLQSVIGRIKGLDVGTLVLATAAVPRDWTIEGRADLDIDGDGRTLAYRLDFQPRDLAFAFGDLRLVPKRAHLTARGAIAMAADVRGVTGAAPPAGGSPRGGSPLLGGGKAHATSANAKENGIKWAPGRVSVSRPGEPTTGGKGLLKGSLGVGLPIAKGTGPLTARIEIGEVTGTIAGRAVPPELSPLTLDLDGTLDLRAGVAWQGRTDLTTSAAGRLVLDGRIEAGGPAAGAISSAPMPSSAPNAAGGSTPTPSSAPNAAGGSTPVPAGGPNAGGSTPVASSGPNAAGGSTPVPSSGANAAGAPATAPASSVAAGPSMDMRWTWSGIDLGTLAHMARSLEVGLPASLALAGSAEAQGTVKGPLAAPVIAAIVTASSLEAAMREQPTGRLAQGSAQNPESVPPLTSSVPIPGGAQIWALHGGSIRASLLWTGGGVHPVEIVSLTGTGQTTVQNLPAVRATLTARGSADPVGGEILIDEAVVAGADLFEAKIEGRTALFAPMSATAVRTGSSRPAVAPGVERGHARIHIAKIDLPRWQTYLRPIIGDLAPGYSVKGKAEADLTGTLGWDGAWTANGTAAIGESGFSSEDGSHVLEGLNTSWDVHLSSAAISGAPIVIRSQAKVGGFQILWGSLFADDSQLPSTLDVTATLASFSAPQGASRSVTATAQTEGTHTGLPSGPGASIPAWSVRAVWILPNGPHIDASFEAASARSSGELARSQLSAIASPGNSDMSSGERPPRPIGESDSSSPESVPMNVAYTVGVQIDDLGSLARTYLHPFGDSLPFFQKVEAAGSAHLDAAGTLSRDAQSVRGRLLVKGMRLAGTQQVAEVEGLDLDLPVDLRWQRTSPATAGPQTRGVQGAPGDSGAWHASGEARQGSLRFARAALRGLEIPATATQLQVRADSVELKEPLSVPLLGGTLGLQRLTFKDALTPSRHAEAAIRVSRVSLEEITRAFASIPLEGSVDADFPRVSLSATTLQVDGGGQTRIFGGIVRFGDISGQDILSSYPKITFSADFEDIDLAQVTRKLDFGEMTGLVSGYVRQCELFGGVPVAFVGQIETSEHPSPSRTVNVKAIKNLTILGTGTSTNIFDRGIQRFFDKYTYSRIGVHVELHNDMLVLRGLEHSGDRELFIKGRLPFPINVVNAQPGTAVSFQDMVERIRSLDIGKAKVQH